MTETGKISTSCKGCCFAIFENNNQIGCRFNRLDKFIEVGKTTYRDNSGLDKSHYVIETICNTCRDEKWSEKYDNPELQVKEEIKPRVHAFVVDLSEDGINVMQNRIMASIKSLMAMEIVPKVLHILIQNSKLNREINDILAQATGLGKGIKVNIGMTYGMNRIEDMVDTAVSLVEQPYYMVVKSGDKVSKDYLSKLDKAINSDLKPIIMTDRVFLTGLHRSLGGNRKETYRNKDGDEISLGSLREKIMVLVDEQKNPGAVITL